MNRKLKKEIGIIRSFNRYYTNILGLLDQHILESNLCLSEVRVLHEIEKAKDCTSKKLAEILCMDAGYLSRILKQFHKQGLIEKKPSPKDKRSQFLFLTPSGQEKMDALNARSDEQIFNLIQSLSEANQSRLVQNMTAIETILTGSRNINPEDITVRHTAEPGDIGYITYMHGWIYKQEYNYTTAFEAYVAQSFYDFLLNYNADRDRLWIAEHNCGIIGSIGIVSRGDRAQLRWFLLHPDYRGIGLGMRLLNEAIAFCRKKGYKTVYLDTTDDLDKAIDMYTQAGFVKVAEKENHTWKDNLLELEFELGLERSK